MQDFPNPGLQLPYLVALVGKQVFCANIIISGDLDYRFSDFKFLDSLISGFHDFKILRFLDFWMLGYFDSRIL